MNYQTLSPHSLAIISTGVLCRWATSHSLPAEEVNQNGISHAGDKNVESSEQTSGGAISSQLTLSSELSLRMAKSIATDSY